MNFDLIIVGGGAAGIMAAISAKRKNSALSVAIVDRTFALGRKILVCGAGRCNVTNINLNKEITNRYYGASPEFIQTVFDKFGFQDIVDFFAELGVELYVERKTNIGKLFPVTDQAKTVTAVLEDELKRLGVQVFLNTEVESINQESGFVIKAKALAENSKQNTQNPQLTTLNLSLTTQNLILSAGGKTYPALGSNGSGYELARSLGHTIVTPVPSALPLEGKSQLSHLLQGTRIEIEATSVIDGIDIKSSVDDVMFTQYGLSGPAILNISREISIAINRNQSGNCVVRLNLLPGKDAKSVLEARWQKRPDQLVNVSLYGLLPNKVCDALVQLAEIDRSKLAKDLLPTEIDRLIALITRYEIAITATRGWNEAEFTAGGVETSEVNAQTLESSKVKGLYFCGEILNVDGDVGGFNLSWAWSSGNLAGRLGE